MRSSVVAQRQNGQTEATGDLTVSRRHKPDYQILLFMGLLMLLGLIIMYAIGPQRANVLNSSYNTDRYSDTYFFFKQALSLTLALGAFAFTATMPVSFFRRHAAKLLLGGFIACAILAVAGWTNMGIAQCSLGACRWFNLGPLGTVQPAEFLKFGALLFGAGFLGMRAKQGLINDLHKTLIPLGVIILVAAGFVIGIEKDMGTGIALLAIFAAMLVVAGVSLRVMGIAAGLLVGLLVVMIVAAPHRIARITTFFQGDTTSLANAANYHVIHAKIAIGSGGLTGVGIGNSVQATGYLPEAINDSVFAIMGEMFGFVGLVVIIVLFTALLLRLLSVVDQLQDMRLKLIVAGVFGWLAAHVVLNIAAMIGIFPLTGITLPLLSFGGTSMIFMAAALGLAFQLSRYTSFAANVKGMNYEDTRGRRGVGRSRDARRSRPTNA